MKTIWKWICSLFTKENIGIIWRTLFNSAKSKITTAIHDPAVQKEAFNLAKSLLTSDLTGEQKKELFNQKMLAALKDMGIEVGTSTLNVIRELALEAVKEDACNDCVGNCGDCVVKSVLLAIGIGLLSLGASAAVTTNVTLYAAASDTYLTNVVTNVVFETRVRFDTYPVTNGYVEVYGGTLTTNRVYDTPRYIWRNGGLALITNYVDKVVSGTSTSRVYNVTWGMRPEYYPVAVTNVYTNIFVNGINVRR